jgi:Leucine-rich repeat (LRR) protein
MNQEQASVSKIFGFGNVSILGLIHLKSLDISWNNFDAVPSQLHYDGLEELIVDGNPISILKSHSFSGMTSLRKLSICKMPNLGIIKGGSISKGVFTMIPSSKWI